MDQGQTRGADHCGWMGQTTVGQGRERWLDQEQTTVAGWADYGWSGQRAVVGSGGWIRCELITQAGSAGQVIEVYLGQVMKVGSGASNGG